MVGPPTVSALIHFLPRRMSPIGVRHQGTRSSRYAMVARAAGRSPPGLKWLTAMPPRDRLNHATMWRACPFIRVGP
jgi:hypothetical protein